MWHDFFVILEKMAFDKPFDLQNLVNRDRLINFK